MEQSTINQRLKFLVENLSASARAFSDLIGESPTNTHNYTSKRNAEPRAEYLQKVALHFANVNMRWLLTGEGEPFIGDAPSPPVAINNRKNKGPVQNNTGDHNTITNNVQLDNCKRDLDKATTEVRHLQAQLASKDDVIATKDAFIALQAETLSLLRGGLNRPN